jgi:hypothetical protein
VTRDEIQKLIGGYATGSLSESERRLLFDAALEDQELFDQLAHEQALKELLEEPGARQRLMTALGPEKRNRFVAWPWAVAAAACMAVVMGVVMLRTPDKPREIAAVTKPAEAPAPVVSRQDAEPAPTTPPVTTSAPPKQKAVGTAAPVAAENAPAPVTAVGPPLPPIPPDPPKAEKSSVSVDGIQEVAVAPAPPPPPPPAQPKPAVSNFVGGATSPAVDQIQVAPPVAAAGRATPGGKGGGRGGGGGGGAGFAAQSARARAGATRFAFDYSFDATGALRIVPAAQGYLSVTAPPTILLPLRNVVAGTPVIVQVPQEAAELVVSFSTTAAPVNGAPVRREESAGTVEDPSQRILVTIPVKR